MASCAAARVFAKAAVCIGLVAAPASASSPERDAAWDALIVAAKAHGGVETKLDQSASYVFKRPDGSFLTLTCLLTGAKRSACLVSKDQNATACFDWDSGKVTYGERKAAASPWVVRPAAGETAPEKQGLLGSLLSGINTILTNGAPTSCCNRFGGVIFPKH